MNEDNPYQSPLAYGEPVEIREWGSGRIWQVQATAVLVIVVFARIPLRVIGFDLDHVLASVAAGCVALLLLGVVASAIEDR